MHDKKKIATIIITLTVFVLGIVAVSIFNIIDNERRSAVLEVAVAPLKAKLTLNGTTYTNGTHRLIPGKYEVKLEADGFEPFTTTLELPEHETTYLYHYLTGFNGDMSYYGEHKEEEMNLMTITNYEARMKANAYAEKDPVLEITPYFDEKSSHFSIFAETDADSLVTLKINLNTCTDLLRDRYIKEANDYLASQGIDSDNYSIEYIGLCD